MNNWEKEFDKLDINLIINRDKTGNSMNLLEEYWKILKPIIKEELKNEFKPFIQDLLDKQREEIKERLEDMGFYFYNPEHKKERDYIFKGIK